MIDNFKKYESFDLPKTKFLGYELLESKATILALFDNEENPVNSLTGHGYMIVNQTPLYAMAGGQDSDQGTVLINGKDVTLLDIRKDVVYGYFIHEIDTNNNTLNVNDEVELKVDEEFRRMASINHSALHIIWQTTISLVGHYVGEVGSKVNADKYQLQFECDEALTEELALKALNKLNDEIIKAEIDTHIFYVSQQEAIDKKYLYEFTKVLGDEMVRMIEFPGIVIEPCSGTHTTNTREIKKAWFMSYDKNSKRVQMDMTANENVAKAYFEDKLINRIQELKNIMNKGIEAGLVYDFSSIISRTDELKDIWNYFSIKEVNNLFNEVTAIVNKFLKTKEADLLKSFVDQDLPFEVIGKFKLFTLNNEMYSNKVLMAKASQLANEDNKYAIVFVNKFTDGSNCVLIRNKELDINLKDFNQTFIAPNTAFRGGGTDSMVQLVSADETDALKLINLLK